MKRFFLTTLSLCLFTGCYNVVLLNVGSSAHEAASAGIPQPPEVQCAALAQPKVTGPIANIDALETCEQAVLAQKQLKEKHK
jgi:hypothetical protein